MSRAPSLRFEGFSGDWEQRKLGELAQFSKGTGYSKADLRETGTPIILYGRLYTNYETVISDVDTFADKKAGSVYSRGGEVIVPASGEAAEDISIASVVEKPGIILGGDLNIITPSPNLDSAFLAIRISNGKPHNDMAKMAQGKSVVHLHNTDLEQIDLIYPCYKEQVRISSYFKHIDNLITFHQQKYRKLVSTEKAMLLKLIPTKGYNTPELRFEGFYNNWEWRKLSDMLSPYSDPVPTPREGYERLGIRSYGKGTFYSFVEPGHELGTAQMHRVAADKLIVNITFAWEHAVAVTEESDAGKLVSHRFPQFSLSEDLYPQFLRYLILDERFRHHLLLASPGGAGRNRVLKVDEMLEYRVCVPEYREQKQIADFLNSLEHLIQFHAMQIEKLKNIKAACLEGMFV